MWLKCEKVVKWVKLCKQPINMLLSLRLPIDKLRFHSPTICLLKDNFNLQQQLQANCLSDVKNHVKYFRDSRCSLTRTTMVGDDCDTNSTGSQRKIESYDFPNQKQRLSLVLKRWPLIGQGFWL